MNLNKVFPFDLSDKEQSEFFGKLNSEISDLVFDHIKQAGFTPCDIQYGDTYFIFQSNPNSNIHFRIKELNKHWEFGLWVNSDFLFYEHNSQCETSHDKSQKHVISLFCQYDTQIDKFKPTASSLCLECTVKSFKDYLTEGSWCEFFSDISYFLKFIQNHTLAAYHGWSSDYWAASQSNFDMICKFIKWETFEFKKKQLETLYTKIFELYALAKIAQFERESIVRACYFEDMGEGWVSNPRMNVVVEFNDKVDNADMDECVNRILPCKTDRIGKFSPFDYALGFSFYKDGKWWF